jgi:pimeloyl-ACP methyl ester carboxylesterase
LSQHGYVISYDRAAFGFTERPTSWEGTNPYSTEGQLAVLDELVTKFGEGKQLVLIGHSAGGQLAALYAMKHPDKLSGLVLEDPAILTAGGAPDWLNWIFYIPQLDHLGPLLVSSIATSGLGILDQSYFDKSKITPQTITNYTQPLKVKGWEQAFWEFNRAPRLGVERGELANLQVPTLVITGDADEIVPTKDSIEVAGLIPGAELAQIPNTGHLPHEESSDHFLEAVVRFLEVAKEG